MINGLNEAKRLLKYLIIRAGLETIAALRLDKLLPFAAHNGLVFTLHHVRPDPVDQKFSPNAILSVTPDFLEQTIVEALKAGLIPVHVHELPRLLRDNPQNRRYVCFTLDDGYRNNALYAAPVFRRYNIPYTIYVSSGFAQRENILWWEVIEQLLRCETELIFDFGSGSQTVLLQTTAQKMSAFARFARFVDASEEDEAVQRIGALARSHGLDPMAITRDLTMDKVELRRLVDEEKELVHLGAHTISHINLNHATPERMRIEIETSANWLKDNLGVRARSFAYPYGWKSAVSDQTCSAAREAGFDIAVTTQPGMLKVGCLQKSQAMPRVSLNGYFQKPRYVRALISGLPFIKK